MDNDNRKQTILCAVQTVLVNNGYADLSISQIADEAGIGKSHLYYYFDTKHELMLSFLDYLIEQIKEEFDPIEETNAGNLLNTFITKSLCLENTAMLDLRKALLEMRIQSTHDESIAKRFTRIDSILINRLESLLNQYGVRSPHEIATIVHKTIEGVGLTTLDREKTQERRNIKNHLIALIRDLKHIDQDSMNM